MGADKLVLLSQVHLQLDIRCFPADSSGVFASPILAEPYSVHQGANLAQDPTIEGQQRRESGVR
jgi:hypothetical protein